MTASKKLSSYFKFSESPITISIVLSSFLSFILSIPTSNIPLLMSNPIIFLAFVLTIAIAKSPVPVATSKINDGFLDFNIFTIFFLHETSIPNEITRLSMSYSFEILLNIFSTWLFLDKSLF